MVEFHGISQRRCYQILLQDVLQGMSRVFIKKPIRIGFSLATIQICQIQPT